MFLGVVIIFLMLFSDRLVISFGARYNDDKMLTFLEPPRSNTLDVMLVAYYCEPGFGCYYSPPSTHLYFFVRKHFRT
jgi:hypothetical protein